MKGKKQIDERLKKAESHMKTKEEKFIEAVYEAMTTDELIELIDLLEEEPENPRIDEILAAGEGRVGNGHKSKYFEKNRGNRESSTLRCCSFSCHDNL